MDSNVRVVAVDVVVVDCIVLQLENGTHDEQPLFEQQGCNVFGLQKPRTEVQSGMPELTLKTKLL